MQCYQDAGEQSVASFQPITWKKLKYHDPHCMILTTESTIIKQKTIIMETSFGYSGIRLSKIGGRAMRYIFTGEFETNP